ncbi:Sigma-37 [Urinicoccus massiliensis]|uniref:Sigma-37 n=2 Tax=Urinicoccus massiliensis TaxID=1723382 RepID=A0A8H2MGU3_9FIRM|nr:Sigma-37 [Urinicoccus massiliensis]
MMDRQAYDQLDRQLTKEERKEMFQEYAKTKDQELRDILIEEHLYIAEILSKKYANRGIDYDDIFQVASIGLIYGVERYDPSKGYEFSSFATPTIIGEIKKYFRDKGWTIRVPRRIQELSKKINNAKVTLAQENQKTPTIKDIADYLNVSQEDILESMEASKVYSPTSLDLKFEGSGDDKEVNLSDLIGEDEPYFNQIEVNDFIEKAMEKLNDVEKTILIDRYYNKKTQVAIAEKLDISQMTVSRIEKKVLEKIRKEAYKTANV